MPSTMLDPVLPPERRNAIDVAATTSEHAPDEAGIAWTLKEAELSPLSALEKQLADAIAEMERDQAAVVATPAAAAGAAMLIESATNAASALENDDVKPELEHPDALGSETQPRFPIGARVSIPTVGYVGCVVEGVASTPEGYLYTLRARGIPRLEAVSEDLLK
jgi:hypothetical protein